MAVLNLGAGNRIVIGAVNHDWIKHRPEIDITHNLDDVPWPWDDNSFDEIQLISVAEHLKPTLIETLNECWRILKPNGKLVIKYPLWNGVNTHKDPTHRWFWDLGVLNYVDPSTRDGQMYYYYTDRKWKIRNQAVIKKRNVKATLEPIK